MDIRERLSAQDLVPYSDAELSKVAGELFYESTGLLNERFGDSSEQSRLRNRSGFCELFRLDKDLIVFRIWRENIHESYSYTLYKGSKQKPRIWTFFGNGQKNEMLKDNPAAAEGVKKINALLEEIIPHD